MVFRNSNTKRKYTNRKSKKYGGKCISMTDMTKMKTLKAYLHMSGVSLKQANNLVDDMVNSEYIYDCDNILQKLRKAVYDYELKSKSKVPENNISGIRDVIIENLMKMKNKAAQSQQPKSIPQKPVETQKPDETKKTAKTPSPVKTKTAKTPSPVKTKTAKTRKTVSNDGCPSEGKDPVNCESKKDYLKQTRIFHPDKNPNCIEDATSKFQALQNTPTCQFD